MVRHVLHIYFVTINYENQIVLNVIKKACVITKKVVKTCEDCFPHHFCIRKIRYKCSQCSPYCEHGRKQYRCTLCSNGSGICEHKRRDICIKCKPDLICIHNRCKYKCRICRPSIICKHNRLRGQYKECGAGMFCVHNISKYTCRKCKGGAFYIHAMYKKHCRTCKPQNFCEHNKFKKNVQIAFTKNQKADVSNAVEVVYV